MLDASTVMPETREHFFAQAICDCWGIKNINEAKDTRSSGYVPTVRILQLEGIVCEKIRQKTHGQEDEGKTIKKIFKHYDLDGYGTISLSEFARALETLGCYFKKDEICALFAKHDKDKSGKLDYEEFAGWVAVRGAG